MQLVKPSAELLAISCSPELDIELAARTCYQSEGKIQPGSAEKLITKLLEKDHTAMLEFADMTFRFVCDRGVSHELVRHRLVSFAQESTRYCKYGDGVTFIIPSWINLPEGIYTYEQQFWSWSCSNGKIPPLMSGDYEWLEAMAKAETAYLELLDKHKWAPQQARSVLPNSLKTQICMKANVREWLKIFTLRTSKDAHPQMRELMDIAVRIAAAKMPMLFTKFIQE